MKNLDSRLVTLEKSSRRPGADPALEAAISGALRLTGGVDAMIAILGRIDAGTDTVDDRASLAAIPPYDDSPTELLRLLVRVHEMI